jgi:hypothetical protein
MVRQRTKLPVNIILHYPGLVQGRFVSYLALLTPEPVLSCVEGSPAALLKNASVLRKRGAGSVVQMIA